MTRNAVREKSLYEGLISALAVGGVFIIIGLMFVITPNLWEKANAFFEGFTTVSYPLSSTNTLSLSQQHTSDSSRLWQISSWASAYYKSLSCRCG